MRRLGRLLEQSKVGGAVPHNHVETHDVVNQVPFFENYNAYLRNRRVVEGFQFFSSAVDSASTATDVTERELRLKRYGAEVGTVENLRRAHLSNTLPPTFAPFDRQGRRINGVIFSDHYHQIMGLAREHEVPSVQWRQFLADGGSHFGGAAVSSGEGGSSSRSPHPATAACMERAVLSYLHYQLEGGTGCPLTMMYSAFPCLFENTTGSNFAEAAKRGVFPGDFSQWLEKLTQPSYDPRDLHVSEKKSVMIGMSMTEKQGGSDVRSNTTTAVGPLGKDELGELGENAKENFSVFKLVGHKWFTSAPMCDAFLTLANTEEGPTCFLVPRWLAPGIRNQGLRFQQLKSKLGDRSNASSEVEYDNAIGYGVGKPGQGVKTIISMVNHTRLDCLLGSAALMNICFMAALHHAKHRAAFGATLLEQPVMQNVLCDLALEAEAATALAMWMSSFFGGKAEMSPHNSAFQRISCAISKYHVCKMCPQFVYECLECHGGNGYVEEGFPLARHYRQAPLNAIWEGSGNVIVLDLFRALKKEPLALASIEHEVRNTGSHVLIEAFSTISMDLVNSTPSETLVRGRIIVEKLAVILQGCALLSHGPPSIAAWFIETRVSSQHARHYGTLTTVPPTECKELLSRFFE